MDIINKIFLTTLITCLLAACGSTQVMLSPESTANLQHITLIRVEEPAAYSGLDFGNIGMAFGAIGGAMAGTSSAKTGNNINQIAIEKSIKAGERLTQLLTDRLSTNGYKVTLTSAARDKKTELLDNYSDIDLGESDALMDIVIESIGYATENPITSRFWRPSSTIKVALIDSVTKQVIYSEKYMYGYHNPYISATDIDSPKAYHFRNKEALLSDSDKLAQGIVGSIEEVAAEIASRLKRP